MSKINKVQDLKIEKYFSDWIIIIFQKFDSINIIIKNNEKSILYKNNFKFDYLKKLKQLSSNNTITEIIDYFSIMINKKNIEIIPKTHSIKFRLISNSSNKNENTELTLNEINQRMKKIKEINAHEDVIASVKIFDLGNIVSVSYDNTIKIWNNNLELLQKIENVYNNVGISNVHVKDENHFLTISENEKIKNWVKENDKFIEIKESKDTNLNYNFISLEHNIFSLSDKEIIISELINNKIQKITTLTHSDTIFSLRYVNSLNIIISSGKDGTKIWNKYNFECILYIKEATCFDETALKLIDKNRIIVGGGEDFIMYIISINEKKVIHTINNNFICWTICVVVEKEVFLTGGKSNNIKIYRSDNYLCIQNIKNAHGGFINGILELNNGLILSYSDDKNICIWNF